MIKHTVFLFGIFFTLYSCRDSTTPPSNSDTSPLQFEISFPANAHPNAITGRVFVMISDKPEGEPRLQIGTHGIPFFGKDVENLQPGEAASIDHSDFGYPLPYLGDLPAGEYYIQGFVNIYTEFKRSDGHTLWMHNDQWEGQHFTRSPGNLYSEVIKVTIDPTKKETIRLECKNVIPPVEVPEDTKWVKRVKFQSKVLSEFWGQPIFLGATLLLPKGYDENPNAQYPVNYIQGHFSLQSPNGFNDQDPGPNASTRQKAGYEYYRFWTQENTPRMILVTFQHPCPYYDDSYVVNSPNVGPYDDAIMQELIPYLEEHFRIIRQPYARILSGGSTGGWIALAMQLHHPEFFGGVFSLCPDPVDFNYFQAVNIYQDKNAFYKEHGWVKVPTPSDRTTDGITTLTYQQRNHMELAMGTKNRSGEQIDIFEAAFGPIDTDGYAKSLFDPMTGEIDSSVVTYWKENSDLNQYLQKNWQKIAPQLAGKIHIYTGDMDTYYLNPAVKLMEEYLESTNPHYAGSVTYGDGKPHCWGPERKELLQLMADQVKRMQGK